MPNHDPTGQPRLPSGAPIEILIEGEGVEDLTVVRPKIAPQQLPPLPPPVFNHRGQLIDPCVNLTVGAD